MEDVSKDIKSKYPEINTMYLVADFSKSAEEGFFDKIQKHLSHLDVSILINNVGVLNVGPLESHSTSELKNSLIVNCIP